MSDPNVQRRLNSILHFSIRDFSRSIAAGCYFCRHLENSLRSDAQFQTGDEQCYLDLGPPQLVDDILTRAVNWAIQHILIPCTIYTEVNLMKRLLDAAQQWCTSSYLFWIYIDPSLHINVMALSFKGMQKSLPGLGSISSWSGTSFILSPISSDGSSVDPCSNTSLWTRNAWTGDSTALWRYWFNTCLESHATCRSAEQGLRTYSPKSLVELLLDDHGNLSMWRLVYADMIGTVPYFTLSHCWGSSQPLRLTMDNISLLSKPSPVYGLPRTYRHALTIVTSLGHKYLWIDSLCIIQDDGKDWETESSLMGLTYNHAVCNIAATWAEISGRNDFPYYNDITQAPLNKRGWVVQERYLARRQLSCAKRQLYWECHELSASEEFPYGHPVKKTDSSLVRVKPEEIPLKLSLYSDRGAHTRLGWAELVELYSGCQLTRVSDKPVALSGLANQLQNTGDDVYIFGLWKKDLCQQLCWEPRFLSSSPRTTIQGRIAPTWSWANFDGPVAFDRAYYGTYHQRLYWTKVTGTPTNWTKRLTLRGLALESRISWKYWGHLCGRAHYDTHLSFDTLGIRRIPSSSSTKVSIHWDESISKDDADPEQWFTFQEQRMSDLLFLVVRSTRCTTGKQFDGLVLRMLPHSAIIRFYMVGWELL